VKKNAYIGAGAIVLPGVTIGECAIVAARSSRHKRCSAAFDSCRSPGKGNRLRRRTDKKRQTKRSAVNVIPDKKLCGKRHDVG